MSAEWAGRSLGQRRVSYDERDAILYALAVGAGADDLSLVFEDRLRVLPTFALTLAQWVPDALGVQGAFDPTTAVHGAQRLEVRAPLPPAGELDLVGRVGNVWDKGSAAVFEVEVESDHFLATWSIFAPGCGGFGGGRGPSRPTDAEAPTTRLGVRTAPMQAALYRLLGDRHHMHIDPEAARAAGQPRPFLHGLCSLAAVSLALANAAGAHPADLVELDGRFAAPVFPGDLLEVDHAVGPDGAHLFTAGVEGRPVISGGLARFAPSHVPSHEETP